MKSELLFSEKQKIISLWICLYTCLSGYGIFTLQPRHSDSRDVLSCGEETPAELRSLVPSFVLQLPPTAQAR